MTTDTIGPSETLARPLSSGRTSLDVAEFGMGRASAGCRCAIANPLSGSSGIESLQIDLCDQRHATLSRVILARGCGFVILTLDARICLPQCHRNLRKIAEFASHCDRI
jgi:hypothetical protein